MSLPSWRFFLKLVPWLFFTSWLCIHTFFIFKDIETDSLPVDLKTYLVAASALRRGESPYPTIEQSQHIWLTVHQLETDLQEGHRRESTTPLPFGPYVYPPTLALLFSQLNLKPFIFIIGLACAIYGFGWLWIRSTGSSGWWLFLIMGSWDVLASFLTGNVEHFLLFATLSAAWLLWGQHSLWAAPLIALVVLIKPFYGLFFVEFGLFLLSNQFLKRRVVLKSLIITAFIALMLVGLEVYRWGDWLRTETDHYMLHALDYYWFVWPTTEQTPMSIWNRTPLQGLINAGLTTNVAQWGSWGLWLTFFLITLWRLRKKQLTFPLSFALALLLLYWGRPIGWGLIYLEIVVLLAVWSALLHWQRNLLLGAMLALGGSHWWALILTMQGEWLRLVTLQSANFPWETWTVIPLCWVLLLAMVSRLSNSSNWKETESVTTTISALGKLGINRW